MDPITSTLLAAGLPVVTELLKSTGSAIGRRFFGMSVDDQIKLMAAEVERLKALAGLDAPTGTPTQWVVDLRASFRYIAAGLLVVVGSAVVVWGAVEKSSDLVDLGAQLAGFPFGFIFGERMILSLRSRTATPTAPGGTGGPSAPIPGA